MKIRHWVSTLSVPKILTVLCLLGLGVNGLVQVGLQKNIAAKSDKLSANITQAEQLSADMKNGVSGMQELRDTTLHMENTLQQLGAATNDMDQGLVRLDKTVSGINGSVLTIGSSTQDSVNKIQTTESAAQGLLSYLQKIAQINSEVIANLNQMMQDQGQINQNLQEMNRKTRILPRMGGN